MSNGEFIWNNGTRPLQHFEGVAGNESITTNLNQTNNDIYFVNLGNVILPSNSYAMLFYVVGPTGTNYFDGTTVGEGPTTST